MIRSIAGGRYTTVQGGTPSSAPYINQSVNNPMHGMLRMWGSDLQVFDSTSNTRYSVGTSHATVDLDPDSQAVLQWARQKRNDEQELQRLAEKHPAMADAMEALNRAQDQVRIIAALVDTA
jgi:hypothetical protein